MSAVISSTEGGTPDALRKILKSAADDISFSVERSVEQKDDPMSACYLTTSYPALLHFAFKHAGRIDDALLASTNAGGENVARGACLGALMGAHTGREAIPSWMVEGLHGKEQLEQDIEGFVQMLKQLTKGAADEL